MKSLTFETGLTALDHIPSAVMHGSHKSKVFKISRKSEGKTLKPQSETKMFAVNCRVAVMGENCYWIHLTSTVVYQLQTRVNTQSVDPVELKVWWLPIECFCSSKNLQQLFLLSILYERNECYLWSAPRPVWSCFDFSTFSNQQYHSNSFVKS